MASIGKKLILDLARLSSMCYCAKDDICDTYKHKRPYGKMDNACVFNTLKECPVLHKSDEDCEVLLCNHESDALVVAFRGTSSGADVLTDLSISRTLLPLAHLEEKDWPLVHSGFAEQFFSVNGHVDTAVSEADWTFVGWSTGDDWFSPLFINISG
jgi:hypothetical protein